MGESASEQVSSLVDSGMVDLAVVVWLSLQHQHQAVISCGSLPPV